MPYDAPTASGMPFVFTDGGYVTPDATGVPFSFEDVSTADLQAFINVIGADSVKECPTYTIATQNGVQVIQLPCIYTGFRDIGAYIYGNPTYANLGAYLNAISYRADLGAYIKSTIQATKNLGAYTKAFQTDYTNLGAAIRRIDHGDEDLVGNIHGWDTKDLGGEIGAHPPADLTGILNVIEVGDLPASITGTFFHGQTDLGAEVYRIYQRGYLDLGVELQGYAPVDLGGSINAVYFYDLQGIIQSISSANLNALINAVAPIDLPASLHGWDTLNLPSVLIGGYGPGDLQASILPIPPTDLSAYIKGYKGIQIPFDLQGIVESWGVKDLSAVIGVIAAADLGAFIEADGTTANLGATIIPKTILMKRALQIALLEHKDLKAMVNFQCFNSNSVDLPAEVYALSKMDLQAFIIGWYGGTADNVKDLGAYVNAADFNVQDRIPIRFVPEITKYTELDVRFSVTDVYTTFDTIDVLYSSLYAANLTASINGILTSLDLGASINPVIQANFTELPDNVYPKTHEVVFDLTDKGKENWRRFVEIMFRRDGAEPYHYFYVSGSGGVYKIDRDRHWTIWADSYLNDDEDMIERKSVRRKYIFNMRNYDTVDAAVRDLIDRVSDYRKANLGASITPIDTTHLDLSASISSKYKRTWVKHLGAIINGV